MHRSFALAILPALIYIAFALPGIRWGLPSRDIDRFLFRDEPPWSGEKIYRLAKASEKFDAPGSASRGADVDADPIAASRGTATGESGGRDGQPGAKDGPPSVHLTRNDEDVARILLRYRLYTHQPDEMITLMALAGMRPRSHDFDPRLYQYGGLFIYPVGALLGVCDVLGLIDVRGDVTYYLDHPDEFGKFYVVSRAYSAAWGLVGVIVVFAIAWRLGGVGAGWLAATLFAMLPVVVCMAHEGKPHLPGAALMLIAVWLAMRCVAHGKFTWFLLCAACGASVGMVLSSWPIFVLIPLVAWRTRPLGRAILATVTGAATGVAVYLLFNPYIAINLVAHRDVLRSNFGNSLAMYEVARVGEGFIRVLQLTMEGATIPVLAVGGAMMLLLAFRASRRRLPQEDQWQCLLLPAALLFAQFVLIGAEKPAEYGRFGVFTNTALAIAAAVAVQQGIRGVANRRGPRAGHVMHVTLCLMLLVPTALYGWGYTSNFIADSRVSNSRRDLARVFEAARIDETTGRLALEFATIAEPAPYNFPPIPFHRADVFLLPTPPGEAARSTDRDVALIEPLDRTRGVVPTHAAPLADVMGATMPDLFDIDTAARLAGLDARRQPPWGLARFDPRHTPISWANKPFFNSLFEWKARGADPPILRPKIVPGEN